MSFHKRSKIAFLIVPWMIILFLTPFFLQKFWIEKNPLQTMALFSILIVILTYILELTVGLPILKYLIGRKKTTLSLFMLLGFILATLYSALISSFLGLGIFFIIKGLGANYLLILMFFGLVGASEAAVYWAIARPDKFNPENSAGEINNLIKK